MKLKYLLLFLPACLLLSCASKSNSYDLSALFKKWKIDYVEMNNQKLEAFVTEEGSMEYEFRKDNTYTISDNGISDDLGAWEFNSDENCVYLQNSYGEITGKVITISGDKIILIPATKIGHYPQFEFTNFITNRDRNTALTKVIRLSARPF